jgi:oligopeptide/dipeptide ABC transporter ATP-binding protein
VSGAALSVEDLGVSVERPSGRFPAVDGVSFEVAPGAALGIVGESGSGKSLTLRALMALVPPGVRIETGRVALDGDEVPLQGREARRVRRGRMALVFQDPLSALNPVYTVGAQVAEVPQRVLGLSRRRAWQRAIELLRLVGIPDPARRSSAYPHQLSGGMRQRVVIAIALASEPSVLLLDEPTTALDVTVQAQVLDLVDSLRTKLRLTVVFVSHDLAVVRQLCDTVAVMYTGRVVESGPTTPVLERPRHPYTLGLLAALVDLGCPIGAMQPIRGALPNLEALPGGCPFHPRCGFATEECAHVRPPLYEIADDAADRASACLHHDRLAAT